MVRVEFLGPIGHEPVEIEAQNLQEVAAKLREDSELTKWLENSAVAVNDMMIQNPEHPLSDGDVVKLLPPVCGG